jgi:hypothetical protein
LIVIAAMMLSFWGPLHTHLPDGSEMPAQFAALALPMHVFATVTYLAMTIRSVPRQ